MPGPLSREQYPWWVTLSLWGVRTRAAVWGFVWLSIGGAVLSTAYAAWRPDQRFYLGALLALAAVPYWLTIRWVDRHGSWP